MRTIVAAAAVLFASTLAAFASTCTGSAHCKACRTCQYCRHCALLGGSCSVKLHSHAPRIPIQILHKRLHRVPKYPAHHAAGASGR